MFQPQPTLMPIDRRLNRDEESLLADPQVKVNHLLDVFGCRRAHNEIEPVISPVDGHLDGRYQPQP